LFYFNLLILATIICTSVLAKNKYEIIEHVNLKTPRVQAYDASVCAFDNGIDHWCLDHQT
jgi:hypothetical protein